MENTKQLLRPCPICAEKTGRVLHTQKFSLPEKSVLPSKYDVVSCGHCGFCFADTSADQKDYDQYYNQMSKYEDKETGSGGGLNPIDKKRLSTAAGLIADALKNTKAEILDIGCANGGLLQCFDELGYKNLTGIDITPICVENVKKLGYQAFFGGVFDLTALQEKKYDAVVLSHVLEHLYDLKQTVVNLKSLLKPGGIIYIEVPDASRYHSHFVVPYYYFDCEHINHFDKDALKNLFEDERMAVLSVNERDIMASADTPYPAVSVIVGDRPDDRPSAKIIRSERVVESISRYVELSKQKADYSEIVTLAEQRTPVIVWGAGMYTLRLMENSPLSKCNIVCFLDKDFKKQGNSIDQIIIRNPYDVLKTDKDTVIIIASAIYGNEITKEIRTLDANDSRRLIIL